MTTPDLATIVDEQEAEIVRLRAELAVVRRDWQSDVGTLTANLNTAEARVVRAKLEFLEALERAQTAEAQRDAARAEAARLCRLVDDLMGAIGYALIYASGQTESILRRALGDDDAALRGPAQSE